MKASEDMKKSDRELLKELAKKRAKKIDKKNVSKSIAKKDSLEKSQSFWTTQPDSHQKSQALKDIEQIRNLKKAKEEKEDINKKQKLFDKKSATYKILERIKKGNK